MDVLNNEIPNMLWMAKVRRGFSKSKVNKFLGLPETTSETTKFKYIHKLVNVMGLEGYETKDYNKDYLEFMKEKSDSNVKKMVKYVCRYETKN